MRYRLVGYGTARSEYENATKWKESTEDEMRAKALLWWRKSTVLVLIFLEGEDGSRVKVCGDVKVDMAPPPLPVRDPNAPRSKHYRVLWTGKMGADHYAPAASVDAVNAILRDKVWPTIRTGECANVVISESGRRARTVYAEPPDGSAYVLNDNRRWETE